MRRNTRMVWNRRSFINIAGILVLGLIGGLLNRLLIVNLDYNTMAASFVVKSSSINTTTTYTTTISSKRNTYDDSQQPMLSFRWEYLDPNQKATCGGDKCLFRSSSRVSTTTTHLERETGWTCSIGRETQHPAAATTTTTTGYLVAKNNKYNESIFDGWKISEYLTSEFGIKHFLLEPPIQAKIDKSTAQALFLHRDRGRNDHNNETENKTENEAYLADAYGQLFGSSADDDNDNGDNNGNANGNDNANGNANAYDSVTTTVQKIRIALDYWELRLKHTDDEIVSRLEELLESGPVESGTIETSNVKRNSSNTHGEPVTRCGTPLSIFFERLDAGVAQTLELLRCEPLMALDFQVIVDAGGNLYHLDFDRVLTQLGGLRKYNRTHFDSKVRSRLEGATRVLSTVRRWIQTKQQHQQQQQQQQQQQEYQRGLHSSTNTTATTTTTIRTTPNVVPTRNASSKCQGNWEDEESAILVSRTLSCLATERVAMVRHTTTSTMAAISTNTNNRNATPTRPHQRKRKRERLLRQRAKGSVDDDDDDDDDYRKLKHPLLVALVQRVIEGGFYDGEGVAEGDTRDCNVYGDRVVS